MESMLEPIVIYASKSGNTKEIANLIADTANCDVYEINNSNLSKELSVELLQSKLIFLGTGIYGEKPNKKVYEFFETLEGSLANSKITIFLTWFGRGDSYQPVLDIIEQHAKKHGMEAIKPHFKCYGERFKIIRRNHPNETDRTKAVHWASKILSTYCCE